MNKIQMVDLVGQYNNIQEEVDQAILDVVKSSAYINGPDVKAFASELENYLGVKHVIPCGNGTDALQIALMALGLKPGDEVITSDFTFAATVEVIELLQCKSVLVDVDPDTFDLDIESVRKAITPKTKAIIPVHLFGQCANMEEIMKIAKEHDIKVVEDTAQAIGARYTFSNGEDVSAGCIGDAGTTSFFPSKNLGGYGDGGAIFTNDDKLAEDLRCIVNHGMRKRYYHELVGVNSRLDTIQAAVLRIKLRHLDSYIANRQKAAAYYDQHLANHPKISVPARMENSTHVFHQYTLKIDGVDQFQLQEKMKAAGIPVMIYYPVPLHNQEAYKGAGYIDSEFEITNKLCKTVISLPMHTELDTEQQDYIIENLIKNL